jgi:hypothetical protein
MRHGERGVRNHRRAAPVHRRGGRRRDRCLAKIASPDDFAETVLGAIDEFEHHDRGRHLAAARRLATPGQRRALDARAAIGLAGV